MVILFLIFSFIHYVSAFFGGNSPRLFSSNNNADATIRRIDDLSLSLNYGVIKTSNEELISLIDGLKQKCKKPTRDSYLSKINGKWNLQWTTEKETLLFARSGFFGKKVSSIVQDLNVKDSVNNSIFFEDSTSFCVDGKAFLDETNFMRRNFKFTKAVIEYQGFKVQLPPVGSGWFETVYIDDDIRISYDIRKDYSVFKRSLS